MAKTAGIFQLENGAYGFRFVMQRNGRTKNIRRTRDEAGQPLRTKKAAERARAAAMIRTAAEMDNPGGRITRRTVSEVWREYCDSGRTGKAYSTIRKQNSLWNNHIKEKYGRRYVDELTAAEVSDYLAALYHDEGRVWAYVEGFLKVIYLIIGQAYGRNYITADTYAKLCKDKSTKIHMPPRRVDDEEDVIIFTAEELAALDRYFTGTTLQPAYMLGRFCGLRIAEAFGLVWSDIDLQARTVTICRQLQYINGIYMLTPVKTRNGRRTVYMAEQLAEYLETLKERTEKAAENMKERRAQRERLIPDSAGGFVSSLQLVNSTPGGEMRTPNSMKRHVKQLRDEHGINFKFHYLRHTYGTRMAEMGTPPHLLCSQMGHASSKVTERYYLTTSKSGADLIRENANRL